MADTAARIALVARRYEVARFTISVTGIDLTGVTMNMQVRLQRGTPGAPLISLATVTTAAAEGLKLDSVTTVNGLTTSIIKGRINQSTMNDATKVPFTGELGADTMLSYAMQWTIGGDANTRIEGEFIVRDSAYGSDNAPVGRPEGYGFQRLTSAGSSGSLTFGDQVISVSISGAELLAPIQASAAANADRAGAAALAAGQAADRVVKNEYMTPIVFDPYNARQTSDAFGSGSTFLYAFTLAEHFGDDVSRRLSSVTIYTTVAVTGAILKRVRETGSGVTQWVEDLATINLNNGRTGYSLPATIVFAPNEKLAVFIPGSVPAIASATGVGSTPYVPGNFASGSVTNPPEAGAGMMMSAVFLETSVVTAQQKSANDALRARYPIPLVVDAYGNDPGTAGGTDNITMYSDVFGQDKALLSFNLRTQNATPSAIYSLFTVKPDGRRAFVRNLGKKDLAQGDNVLTAGVDFPFVDNKGPWCIGAYAPGPGISISSIQYGANAGVYSNGYYPEQNRDVIYRAYPLRISVTVGTAPPAKLASAEHQSFKRLWPFRYPNMVASAQGTLALPYYDMPIYPPTLTARGLGDAYVRKGVGQYTGLPANCTFGNINVTRDPFAKFPLWIGHLNGFGGVVLGRSDDGKNWQAVCVISTPSYAQNSYICAPFIDFDGTMYLVVTYQTAGTRPDGGIYAGLRLFRSNNAANTSFTDLGWITGSAFGSAVIDGTMYRQGDKYMIAAKNEVDKTIFVAAVTSTSGPPLAGWAMDWDMGTDQRISGARNGGMFVEGPKLSFRNDGGVRVYFDRYSTGAPYEGFSFADAPYYGGPLGPICPITTSDDFNPPRNGGVINPPRAGEVVEMPR